MLTTTQMQKVKLETFIKTIPSIIALELGKIKNLLQ